MLVPIRARIGLQDDTVREKGRKTERETETEIGFVGNSDRVGIEKTERHLSLFDKF